MSLLNSLKIKRYEDKSVQYISQPLGGNEPILQQSKDHFYEVRASAPGGASASSSARPVNVIQPEPVAEKDVQQPPFDSGLEPDATAVHLKPAETVAASPRKGKLQVSTVIEEEVAVGKKKGRGGKRSALGPSGSKKKIKVGETVNLSDLETPEVEIHSLEGRPETPFLTTLEAHASGDDEVEEGDEGVKGAGGDEGNSSTVVKRVAAAFAQSVMVDPAQSDDIFVPGWTLRNKDRVNDSTLAKNMLFNLATPADHIHHREMTNVDVSQAFLVNQAQSNFIGIEMYRRWVDSEARLAKLLKRGPPCNKHDALIEDLKSEVIQSKATIQAGQAALAAASEARDSALSEVDNLKGLMKKRESEVNHNISEMEKVLAQMRTNYATLEDEKKKLVEEKKELESNFSKVSAESQGLRSTIDDHLSFKKFILTEGMELVSRHLHKGPVMTKAVSDVVNAMNLCGFAEGIKAGYDGAASGIPLDKNVQVPANADADLNAAVQAFDTIVFPEIQKLQDLVGEDIGMVVTTLRGLKIQDST